MEFTIFSDGWRDLSFYKSLTSINQGERTGGTAIKQLALIFVGGN
jgi:hypothetical protein